MINAAETLAESACSTGCGSNVLHMRSRIIFVELINRAQQDHTYDGSFGDTLGRPSCEERQYACSSEGRMNADLHQLDVGASRGISRSPRGLLFKAPTHPPTQRYGGGRFGSAAAPNVRSPRLHSPCDTRRARDGRGRSEQPGDGRQECTDRPDLLQLQSLTN